MHNFVDFTQEPWAADKTLYTLIGKLKKQMIFNWRLNPEIGRRTVSYNDIFITPRNLELRDNIYKCIAGGSLSNHIYSYINDYKYIDIKDIDVFFHSLKDENYFRIEPFLMKTLDYGDLTNDERRDVLIVGGAIDTRDRKIVENRTHEAKLLKKSEQENYKIFNVEYCNDINYIGVNGRNKFFSTLDYTNYILQGFDLNQSQIAIYDVNVKNQEFISWDYPERWSSESQSKERMEQLKNSAKFHYTKDFIKYLDTKTLEIVNPYSFASTCLRLFSKTEQIPGISCNIEKELFIATQFYLNFKDYTKIRSRVLKTNEKFLKYKTFLEDFFTFDEEEHFINFIPKIKKIELRDKDLNFKEARKFFEKEYFQSRAETGNTGREMVSMLQLKTPEMFEQPAFRVSPHSR